MKVQRCWVHILVWLFALSGCVSTNVFDVQQARLNHYVGNCFTAEVPNAYHASVGFDPDLDTIVFHHLAPHTTYWWWLSPRGTGWVDTVLTEGQSPVKVPRFSLPESGNIRALQERLELTLYDMDGNMLMYNDDWETYWTEGSDTLAAIKYRTTDVVPYGSVYLRIRLCEDSYRLREVPFEVHFTAYPTPSVMERRILWETDTMQMRLGIDPTDLEACEGHVEVEVADTTMVFRRNGILQTVKGAMYDTGAGFSVYKEHCGSVGLIPNDHLEYCLHNFKAYWFVPPQDDLYEIYLDEMGELYDSLGIVIFHDREFVLGGRATTLSGSISDEDVEQRVAQVCGNVATGLRMIGAGRHRDGVGDLGVNSSRLYAGQADNGMQGIFLEKGKVYYILVAGPMFRTFRCRLNLKRTSGYASGTTTPCEDIANPSTVDYVVPCSLATFLGTQSGAPTALSAYLPATHIQREWGQISWYEMAPSSAAEMDITVTADFEGKVAAFTYGDPRDARTYEKLKDQLFEAGRRQSFTITPPRNRAFRIAIAHRPAENGRVELEIVPRGWSWNRPLDD